MLIYVVYHYSRAKRASAELVIFVVKCCYVDCEGSSEDFEDGVQDRK